MNYQRGKRIHEDDSMGLTVFKSWSRALRRPVLLKVFSVPDLPAACTFVRKALDPAHFESRLQDMFVCECAQGVEVNVVLERPEKEVDWDAVRRDDRAVQSSSDTQGYFEISYANNLEDVNAAIRRVLQQAAASFASVRNCRPLDFAIECRGSDPTEVHLFLEPIFRTLEKDIEKRAKRPYSETELLELLRVVTEGLLAAERVVRSTQGLAHGSLSASCIFLCKDGWKVAGYGEKLEDVEDKIDAYCLGLTMLHAASLSFPHELQKSPIETDATDTDVQRSLCCWSTAEVVETEVSQLQYSSALQLLLLSLLHTNPDQRAHFDNIYAQVSALLKPAPVVRDPLDEALALRETATAYQAERRFKEYLHSLQAAWKLFQSLHAEETPAVGLELGEVLCLHFSRFSEAEEVLQQCYSSVSKGGRFSESALRISIGLIEVRWYSDRYAEAEALCGLVLQSYSRCRTDLLWEVVYYLALSQWAVGKEEQANSLLREWTDKEAKEPRAQFLRLCILAAWARRKRDFASAESMHEQAQALATAHFATSILAAYNLRLLGWVFAESKQWEKALRTYREAKTLFDTYYGQSLAAASNLVALGQLCLKTGQQEEGMSYLLAARAIYQKSAPQSINAASNLNNLGIFCYRAGRLQEAATFYEEAIAAYAVAEPASLSAGNNLYNAALLFAAMGQSDRAVRLLEEALNVFTRCKSELAKTHVLPALSRLKSRPK